MNLRQYITVATLALAATLAGAKANASDLARLDTERFRAAPDGNAGFAVGDATIPEAGKYAVGFTLHNAVRPLVLQRESGERISLIGNRLGGSFTALVGLGGPVALGLELPVAFLQTGSLEALPTAVRPGEGGSLGMIGLGDLRLMPRLAILQQGSHGVDLVLDAALAIPTGRSSAMLGDAGFGGAAIVTAGRTFGDIRVLAQTGVRFRPSREILAMNVGSELLLRGAALYTLPFAGKHLLPREVIAELDLATLAAAPFQGGTTPAEWRVGARMCVAGPLSLTAGVGGPLSGAYGTPLMRALVGVGIDPRGCGGDRDGDGIPDDQDRCPTLPGVTDHDGCPPPQPVEPAKEESVPEVEVASQPADRDGDGVPDSQDLCPDVPGIPAYRGCPFPDQDGDGVPDDEDLCPREFGLRERGGCPIRDRDNDGVEDFEDRCPEEPGPADRFGCPLRDTDGDGLPDDEDNCPAVAGPKKNFGCPDPQLVALRLEHIELLEKIAFAEGTANILPASDLLLSQLAAVIRAQPQLPRIRIEGHTDNRGEEAALRALSKAQAEAVRARLVAGGVSAERLLAVGRGAESPVAPNLTVKGREANRRIELRIVTIEEGELAAPVPLTPDLDLPGLELQPLAPPVAEPATEPAPAAEDFFFDALPLPDLDDLPPLD